MERSIQDDWILVSDLDSIMMDSVDPGLPRDNPTVSSWQVPPDALQKYTSSKTLPRDILDVAIIGSGVSGTSVAWHLLHNTSKPLRTIILEARDVCSGATGRNGTLIHRESNDRRTHIL
jgi:hypothetical protein